MTLNDFLAKAILSTEDGYALNIVSATSGIGNLPENSQDINDLMFGCFTTDGDGNVAIRIVNG